RAESIRCGSTSLAIALRRERDGGAQRAAAFEIELERVVGHLRVVAPSGAQSPCAQRPAKRWAKATRHSSSTSLEPRWTWRGESALRVLLGSAERRPRRCWTSVPVDSTNRADFTAI